MDFAEQSFEETRSRVGRCLRSWIRENPDREIRVAGFVRIRTEKLCSWIRENPEGLSNA